MYKILVRKESSMQVSVFVTGFTALVVQIIFLRTFLTILNGNELVIGMMLCNWMLLTGLGAKLGNTRWIKSNAPVLLHVFTGVLPAMLVFLIFIAKSKLFPPGVLPGFSDSWLLTLIAMAPFCLLSGAMFTVLAKLWSRYALQNKTTRVYAIEAIGSLTGSLLFVFLLIRIFAIPEILVAVASANFAAAILLSMAFHKKRYTVHLIFIGLLAWMMMHFVVDWYGYARSQNFQGQKILEEIETPYGNLVVTGTNEQINVFENGMAGYSSGDFINPEECVHFAMVQLQNPESVLVVSGDLNGIFTELSKYENLKIDFVETNPISIAISKQYFGLPKDPNTNIQAQDPIAFLKSNSKKYDAILLQIPPPVSLQFNRFYSVDFFNLLKSKMTDQGVVSLRLEGNSNYLGKDMHQLYSVLMNTVREVFPKAILIPGQSVYLLASRAKLSYNISEQISKLGIETHYVNPFFIDDELLAIRGQKLMSNLDLNAVINSDFRPAAFFIRINHWLSWYGVNFSWVIVVIILIFTGLLLALSHTGKAMFSIGFTASSVEIMAMMIFQIMFGNLYQDLALLLAAFMAGLAAGAFVANQKLTQKIQTRYLFNPILIGVLAISLPAAVLLWKSLSLPNVIFIGLLYLIVATSGLLTGLQFSWSNKFKTGSTGSRASGVYSADLLGSAGGAIITAVVLIPLVGIIYTGFILLGLNILTFLWLLIFRKSVF